MDNIFWQKGLLRNKQSRGENFMGFGKQNRHRGLSHPRGNTLSSARVNKEYIIKMVDTNNNEIQDFLFTLGCYEGEKITIISILADQFVIVVKDARYSIDKDLADCIII
jgi:Fe2+ transport system protein FeoA